MLIGELHRTAQSFVAASNLAPRKPVKLAGNGVVVLSATNGADGRTHGITGAATALQGESVTVYEDTSVVEVTAAASVGPGALVGVASTNGDFGPATSASGIVRRAVGESVSGAAAGERFSLYVKPVLVSGAEQAGVA